MNIWAYHAESDKRMPMGTYKEYSRKTGWLNWFCDLWKPGYIMEIELDE